MRNQATLLRGWRGYLKPGGTLAIYDILAGPAGPVHFPVPWAQGPETSFLATPDELRRSIDRHIDHRRWQLLGVKEALHRGQHGVIPAAGAPLRHRAGVVLHIPGAIGVRGAGEERAAHVDHPRPPFAIADLTAS